MFTVAASPFIILPCHIRLPQPQHSPFKTLNQAEVQQVPLTLDFKGKAVPAQDFWGIKEMGRGLIILINPPSPATSILHAVTAESSTLFPARVVSYLSWHQGRILQGREEEGPLCSQDTECASFSLF